jgi:hypothetical protein
MKIYKGRPMKKLIFLLAIVLTGAAIYWKFRSSPYDTGHPLVTNVGPVNLLKGLDTDTLPEGWVQQTFFRITPTDYRIVHEDGQRVLRCTTDNSASILARDTRVALDDLPMLTWRWKVTQPIESEIDEATEAGDDHPLRFYLQFANELGETRETEIIWSNRKFAPGDFKIIGSFYHLVANGLAVNVGQWHDQVVDLRQLYRDIGGTGVPTLEVLGFFCDSDNTGAKSDGFIGDVTLSAQGE